MPRAVGRSNPLDSDLHLYETKLSLRFEAETDEEARVIARQMGDLAVQHPLAIDVAEEETHRV